MNCGMCTCEDDVKVEIKEETFEEVLDIKDEVKYSCEDGFVREKINALPSDVGNVDVFVDDESIKVVKDEESEEADLLLEVSFPLAIPASRAPFATCNTHQENRQKVNPQQLLGENLSVLAVKKLMKLTVPKRSECSRWSKHTTKCVLQFLKSFATIAQSCRSTFCADSCLALRGPRILKCEECFIEFSGLHDRYLKLFSHYKTNHGSKCNVLIGQRWNKHKALLDSMVQAWKIDLKFELSLAQKRCAIN